MKKHFYIAPFILFLLAFLSCAKEETRISLPYAPVNFKIDVIADKIDFFGYATFERPRLMGEFTGYSGLLVFRNQDGTLFAYDLCCPHEKNKYITVKPNTIGEAVCPVCGSVYEIWTGLGNVKSGAGTQPLQTYRVLPISESVYRIQN